MLERDPSHSDSQSDSHSDSQSDSHSVNDSHQIEVSNTKLAAGLSAMFLGAFGVHKFILRYNTAGAIMLAVSVLTCGLGAFVMGVIGVIEGILYLSKTPDAFDAAYLTSRRPWF